MELQFIIIFLESSFTKINTLFFGTLKMAPRPNVSADSNGDFYTPGIDAKLERIKPFISLSHK